MNDSDKQLVEQISGAAMATVETTARLVMMLVRTKTLTLDQAALTFSDMSGHIRDLARRNEHIKGQAAIYKVIADRYDVLLKGFQEETGAKVDLNALK